MRMNVTPNFTPRAQKAIGVAKKIARELNSKEVLPAHLLIAILESRQFSINAIFEGLGIDTGILSALLQDAVDSNSAAGMLEYSESFKEKIKESLTYASKFKHDYVGLEHLLFVCLDSTELKIYLEELGHNTKKILNCIEDHIISNQRDSKTLKNPTPSKTLESSKTRESALGRYSLDYTKLAEEKKLDEVFFKDREIREISEVLCRKAKNNPVLLGDAGVGKTAIVECLAQKIVSQDAAEFLLDKRIHVVDLPSMIAGTKYRGQFEERLKKLIQEAAEDPRVILFIDEIHTLVGAGNSEGSMDAANILKPLLARGKIKCIGATTYEEYRKTILKDSALDRRFHPVSVLEPNVKQSIKILKKVSKSYEDFHAVKYTEDSITYAVELSKKYITDRFLPDKAIDLIDQAASKVKIKTFKRPRNIKRIEKQLQKLFDEEDQAAGHAKSKIMDRAEKAFEVYKDKLEEWAEECRSTGAKVTKEDICRVISEKTKIPYEKIHKDYSNEALELKNNLEKCVIGQEEAVSTINDAVMFSFSGLTDSNKPIGSFLLMGATGLGKTHTAKMIARHLYEREDNFIQFDMSEFSEKTSVSRLIGASPGYVGYEEGSQLIEKVKRNPYCVIVFDEIEKAHDEVLNLLLQILDEGKLTDNVGQAADFSSALIVLTSNIGQDLYQKTKSIGFNSEPNKEEDFKKSVIAEAKKHFKLELLNRIDKIIPYKTLTHKELRAILNIEIKTFQKQLKKKNINLKISASARKDICERAEEENMGARPLQRIFREDVQSFVAKKMVENQNLSEISFKYVDGKITCSVISS